MNCKCGDVNSMAFEMCKRYYKKIKVRNRIIAILLVIIVLLFILFSYTSSDYFAKNKDTHSPQSFKTQNYDRIDFYSLPIYKIQIHKKQDAV